MNLMEILLSEKLKEKNPMLELFGSDRKVLQIACQDLTNYLKFHWNLIGKEANDCEVVEKLEAIFNENRKELDEFLDVWTGIWFKKWVERVKLLIGKENSSKWNRVTEILNNAEPLWMKLSNRHEMQEVLTYTLIKNGEICGTSILAENILKMELGEKRRQKLSSEEEHVMRVVNNAIKRARELARSKGPLIYVKIDKAYYEANSP